MVTANLTEPQEEPRVVVTGIGILSPLGRSLGEIWQALENNAVSNTHLTLPTNREE